MKSLLVTGAKGQLGGFVSPAVQNLVGYRVHLVDCEDLDLSSSQGIDAYFAIHGTFDVIINLAAYTQVDMAEADTEIAERVNGLAPALLAKYCRRMIHISTDYVFDGEKRSPYGEEDKPNPLGQYGASKLRGEKRLLEQKPDSIIIRTSWLYSEFPNNFLTKILKMAKERPELKIVDDQIGTPTYADDLASVIAQIVVSEVRPGIYHFSNEGQTSWYEFAKAFLEASKVLTPVFPVSTSEFKTAARRPMYSVLDKSKIKNELGITIQTWQESLKRCLQKIY